MKANELRIGNLYSQFGNITEVSWCTIKDMGTAPESQLWCKAIPLTEEWLLKFGFEKMKCITFDWENEWIIEYTNMGLFIGVLLGDYPETNPNCGCVSILLPKNRRINAIPKDLYDKENWTKEDEIRAEKHTILDKKWRQPIAYHIKYVHQLQNLYFALTGKELNIIT